MHCTTYVSTYTLKLRFFLLYVRTTEIGSGVNPGNIYEERACFEHRTIET